MSKTMSNPTEWMQFYNPNFPPQPSTAAGSSSPTAATPPTPTPTTRLSPEAGRVTKPVRRRTRASRRTPTTLLNTDTANFRAMVQQFTGGPTAGPHHHHLTAGYQSLHYQPPPPQQLHQQQQGFFGGGAVVGPAGRPVGTTGLEGFLMGVGGGGGAPARGPNSSGSPAANYNENNNGNNIIIRGNNNFMF